ncbi:MAG: hypothetical protein A2053_01295 [Deltaproteobacteria bacterium GWA2_50_8]|nr:MAG: hypothetical protein A2053_01295 [Deltaproteobacteria bacterium GWA2_50_8]
MNKKEEQFRDFLKDYSQAAQRDFDIHHPHAPLLILIFESSPFLINHLRANPLLADFILNSPFIQKEKKYVDFLKEIQESLDEIPLDNIDVLKKILRQYQHREALRLAIRDLSNLASFESIGREQSYLAQAILETGSHYLFKGLAQRYGISTQSSKEGLVFENDFCCLGLGKLGGQDLNFSSDIDLMYVYNENKTLKTKTGQETLSTHEFFSKLCEILNKTLMDKTEDGFVYRVDMGLRPQGHKGPLVNSMDSMERYYEVWGEEWERLALTKAHFMAGSQQLAQQLLKRLSPFIFRKYIDFSSLDHIRKLKNKINKEHIKKEETTNVKLGMGGIREVEFIAGTLQIIYGGKLPALQNKDTLQTLQLLAEQDLIEISDFQTLREAYIFLRRVENRLQMADNQQTHRLPKDLKELAALAKLMGYLDVNPSERTSRFIQDLERHMHDVHQIFSELYTSHRKSKASYLKELHERVINCVGYEDKIIELRVFKQDHEIELKRLDKEKSIEIENLWRHMTWIAEAIVQEAYSIVSHELQKKYGPPTFTTPEGTVGIAEYAIIAMGKLGAEELTYQSDLDIICLYSEEGQTNGEKKITNLEYFIKLTQWLISCLSVQTLRGLAYKIDTELRPSGRSGALVTSEKSFRDYHKSSAWTWEKQALIKARPMGGDAAFAQRLTPLFWQLILERSYNEESAQEIHHLRQRMEKELSQEVSRQSNIKTGYGGIVDIEFLTQYLQLHHAKDYYQLHVPKTLEALRRLTALHLLDAEKSLTLQNAYIFYRKIETTLRLISDHLTDILKKEDPQLQEVASRIDDSPAETLWQRYLEIREQVRTIYNDTFSI